MSDIETYLNTAHIEQVKNSILRLSPCKPLFLEFHITDRCNSDCYFCNQRASRTGGHELSLSQFAAILSEACEMGLRMVRLSGGGDPTVHPQIIEILDLIKERNLVLVRFDTNGLRLTRRISEKLLECELQVLHVSLQAPTSISWQSLTGVAAKGFYKVIGNIELFQTLAKEKGILPRVYLSFVIDKVTAQLVPEMMELGRRLGVEVHMHGLNNHQYDDEFRDAFQRRNGVEPALYEASYKPVPLLRKGDNLVEKQTTGPCLAPWISAVIKASGDVSICCAAPASVYGNLNQEPWSDIWNGKAISQLRLEARKLFFEQGRDNEIDSGFAGLCNPNCGPKRGMFSHRELEIPSL